MGRDTEFRWRRRGELLHLSASGLMDLEDIEHARERLATLWRQCEARAIVVDIRGAVPLLSRPDWETFKATGPRLQLPATVPIAIVVPETLLTRCDEYSFTMAMHQRMRFFFTSLGDAWSWAARRTDHWRWAPACQLAACPSPRSASPHGPPVPPQCERCRATERCLPPEKAEPHSSPTLPPAAIRAARGASWSVYPSSPGHPAARRTP